jgi:hypothetical protein
MVSVIYSSDYFIKCFLIKNIFYYYLKFIFNTNTIKQYKFTQNILIFKKYFLTTKTYMILHYDILNTNI